MSPEALRLLPAPHERVRELPQLHAGGEGPEGLVQKTRGAAHDPSVDAHLGQPVPVELYQRVEEVEEHGTVSHGSAFRWAKPSSSSARENEPPRARARPARW